MMKRGLLVGAMALSMMAGTMVAQQAETSGKTILLWADGAPGAQGAADVDKPTLTVFLPASNPTRTGVVVAPGGGYQHLSMQKEGEDVARWLNARGVAAFVLKYRLGPTYRYPIELEDAQRAIRTVRANAAQYGIAADHVGMWGSSAGGHLTATAGTHFDNGNAGAADVVERQGSRPDFLVLAYPVITFEAPYAHTSSRKYLLGENPDPKLVDLLSDETQVTKDTPPTFLFATTDDGTVPVINSVLFYEALVKAGVPAEMHLFQHGGHGAGLAAANPALSVWPDLVIKWMRERGFAAPQVP
ncbi:alpha/beta hydrolase [Granulicella arctica]|uniref:Acetyl esterase/lipase n=1 Tax=Granulicella arctica TaxID=940613 RepID=A0A7Y9PJA4_9BACT|nr:alpha/beta hydrolase [Granulicella arctica]NYF80959.1 acetyl esterase/lipase [Granulicella arctica]